MPRYAGSYERWRWRLAPPLLGVAFGMPLPQLMQVVPPPFLWPKWAWVLVFANVPVMLLVVIPWIVHGLRVQSAVSKHRNPICPGCGYPVHDLPTCPECGLTMTVEERKQAWRNANYIVR